MGGRDRRSEKAQCVCTFLRTLAVLDDVLQLFLSIVRSQATCQAVCISLHATNTITPCVSPSCTPSHHRHTTQQHTHLDVAACIKAIQLVDDLKHGPLHLIVTTSTIVKASATCATTTYTCISTCVKYQALLCVCVVEWYKQATSLHRPHLCTTSSASSPHLHASLLLLGMPSSPQNPSTTTTTTTQNSPPPPNHTTCKPKLTNGIHLIKEDEARLFAASHLEQLTNHARTLQQHTDTDRQADTHTSSAARHDTTVSCWLLRM